MTITLDGTSGITAPTYGGTVASEYHVPVTAFKNRIINGGMVIDQRNAGASVTPANGIYTVDRFVAGLTQASKFTVQQNAGAVTPPAGFTNYLGATSSSAYSLAAGDYFFLLQKIEGFNISDLGWGTANAKNVTLSAWVRSSLTGTFGGSITNDTGLFTYPFSYSIPIANTWTQIAITITGANASQGTWTTTNVNGMQVIFSLGAGTTYSNTAGSWVSTFYASATGATSVVGTSGATFYITGVQLEKGSVATSFDQRAYGTELALCQRYYQVYGAPASETFSMVTIRPDFFALNFMFIVAMRTAPTVTLYAQSSGTAGKIRQQDGPGSPQDVTASVSLGSSAGINLIVATTVTGSHYGFSLNASAEL